MDKKDPWARQNEAYHDKIATSYEMSIRPSTLPAFIFYYKKHLKFISKLDKNIKFLDIGAGTGDFCSDLLSWGFKDITANDISVNMLEEIIKRYPTIEINQGDATALSFEDETFDFINIKGCLHHIKNTEKVITEVYRCLKNGGMFRLQEPNHSIKEKLPDNSEEILERTLNYKEIIDILNKSGFAIWKKKLLLHFQTNDKLNKYTGNENLKNLIVKIMNPVCDFWGFGDIFLIVAVKGKR